MTDNKNDNEENLSSVYEPLDVEQRWHKEWARLELFKAEATSKKPAFSMVIPPPNITGVLHLGHALNNTLQDIIARYKRQKGFNVLWVPGIDHAGIATQNVVERKLHDEGTTRFELGREKFIERVWQWKEESGEAIITQLKRLGASCDWTRQRFTMDEGLSEAVREVFVTLYEEDLIYRGDYIINWCPRCHTALSDLESEAEEKNGHLWHLTYPTKDGTQSITVATTRPETILGDVAVAVNPDDDRYKDLIGKFLILPLINKEIPIIADSEVDMDFGTGAVKITPAHDFNDFEMAKRHDLPQINIMDVNASLNENAGKYQGLDRFIARKKIVKDLDALGLLKDTEDYKVRLGACYRCHTVVEPRLSKQWFVKVEELAKPAIEAVENGETNFVPKNWEKTYFEWMRNIRNWCISRQIWWGHRIPAWHCAECDEVTVSTTEPKACKKCSGKNITQDPDVLDTWFSSALWPFSTLGWPNKDKAELDTFYPTSTLFTSFDIIFFWVARMMMMGIKFMGKVPFDEVYIHALIRDADGQKMSKSKGNVIDPLVMIDKFGTDALRFTLAVTAAQGRDIKLSEDRIEGYRNFCNKLWNLARFTLMNLEEGNATGYLEVSEIPKDKLQPADKWIITKFEECRAEVESAIEKYEFDRAARAIYSFTWHQLCDWYVELIKPDLWGNNGEERKINSVSVLASTLRDLLKITHPFMPFITEEINSSLSKTGKSILEEDFPKTKEGYPKEAAEMEAVMEVIRTIRNIRTEVNVKPKALVECVFLVKDTSTVELIKNGEGLIKTLAKVSVMEVAVGGAKPEKSAFGVAGGDIEVFVALKGVVDTESETKRLSKSLEKTLAEAEGIEKKLSNKNFTGKAPKEVVEEQRAKLIILTDKKEKIEAGLERLKDLS